MKKIIFGTLLAAASLMAANYAPCAACHGANGEKAALGKSQIIKGWSADKLEAALHGYKDGSYGGPMKGVMKGQVAKLSDADIKALADQISKF
ncbi:c-type cytochrome [Candidatus Marinarcus aquaticus]|uniref:Cytochrome C n=1 Tax=Candidatus Marinarcus aquaticus TaxID=2044504 RepID=A0A4Q0XSN4_9BACT|nr:c-type cytochrome [Candidatus Marinarcus aquaticus]RXJ60520.1 cytochrome C [Candidatus Marinarcus aquaticus]